MGSHARSHPPAALRPEELERFKADEEFFKSVRYTLEESMNVGIVPAIQRVVKHRMSDCHCSLCTRTRSLGVRCKRSSKRCSRRTWKRSSRRGRTSLESVRSILNIWLHIASRLTTNWCGHRCSHTGLPCVVSATHARTWIPRDPVRGTCKHGVRIVRALIKLTNCTRLSSSPVRSRGSQRQASKPKTGSIKSLISSSAPPVRSAPRPFVPM